MSRPSIFTDKTILITGGTGSFGRAFARRLLTENDCRKVIIFSRDEWKQWEMRESEPIFNHSKIRYFLGDVRDASRLARAFNEVDFLVHAAALKQVPAAEYNPTEFVKTNVYGSMNIIDQAINAGVQKVIGLSTDKAVNPVNLYGATKLCADKLFVAGNVYVGARGYPKFSVVRYGNVLGSRGSVIPHWNKLLKEGAGSLPVTDVNMTRFWITLEQAVDFVINRFASMEGGEIFVPKIPSMKLVDLVEAIAPDIPFRVSGIREGEKLHELMISVEDARHTLEFKDYYAIIPEIFSHSDDALKRFEKEPFKKAPENFAYASNTNAQWLSVEELRELIKPLMDDYQ